MEEQWKTVVTDNGEVWEEYEVSNLGHVRSLKYGKVRVLKPKKQKDGYLQVTLTKDGKQKQVLIHRLVALAFIPNDDTVNKVVVNHLDHNRQNNVWTNLEWCTQQRNVEHGKGSRIRCIETGEVFDSIRQASRITGICHVCIYDCLTGKQKSCKYGKVHFEYVE